MRGAEPTIHFDEKEYRTVGIRSIYRLNDYTKHHPWRYPGSAPVEDPCGVSGGWYDTKIWNVENGGVSPLVPMGTLASTSPMVPKLLDRTTWIAGEETEVAWAIFANHGGGYQYRLCPEEEEPTEGCFQKYPIDFVGDTQWLQSGHGMDTSNRTEIPAVTVPGDKVVPKGSMWRRNPIPPCDDDIVNGALGDDCTHPTFKPAVPDAYGFGIGACDIIACSPKHHARETRISRIGIVDRIRVPNVPAGEYRLQFRWDSEQTPQVWSNCGDVTIKQSGKKTKPFSPTRGCTICCAGQAACTGCEKCMHNKRGDCARCWEPLKGYFGKIPVPDLLMGPGKTYQCLGTDLWLKGGCASCWNEEGACDAKDRDAEEEEQFVA